MGRKRPNGHADDNSAWSRSSKRAAHQPSSVETTPLTPVIQGTPRERTGSIKADDAQSASEPLSYKTLETQRSIRLLTLAPGKLGDQLRFTIEHADLANSPKYDAISYVWGNVCNIEAN